jgi:2-aminoadipate transaminase
VKGLDARNFVLTSGATQAIALAAAAFVNPGEGAVLESLTFAWAFRSLKMRGADVRMADVDEHGLVVESLEQRLHELRRDGVRPKLLYTIPTFHLPTATVMPLERRRRILELAEEWDLVVVEDCVYQELNYGAGQLPPSLLSLDTSGRVLQTHAFSKMIATGFRLGWMCGRPELIQALGVVREDLGVSQWLSRIVLEFMRGGHLEPHLAHVCDLYRGKRDLMVDALTASAGDLVDFTTPQGGLFIWVHLDEAVDWARAKDLAALDGVAVREAHPYALLRDIGPNRYIRPCFTHASPKEIEEGIALLGSAISAAARTPTTMGGGGARLRNNGTTAGSGAPARLAPVAETRKV